MDDIFSSFGDIFSDFFGGGGGGRQTRSRNSRRRGADLRYICEVTLKDVIQGLEKKIEFETDEACGECSGSGAKKGSSSSTCTTCGGAGQVRVNQGFFQMAATCPACKGEGQMIKDPCSPCKGTGRLKKKRNISVSIPAGVDTGTRLRVSGEGQGGFQGGGEGDLYVEVAVKEDKHFERDGDHLFSNLEVDYLQLLLGGEVEVHTVTETTKVEIPKGTVAGATIKVSGQGVPSLRGARRGDLFFTVGVKFPEKLHKQEEELLKQIAENRGVEVKGCSKGGLFGRKK
jgi:molecular chaperone DnaJ